MTARRFPREGPTGIRQRQPAGPRRLEAPRTVSEIAALLGWSRRRAMRWLCRVQARHGATILRVTGKGPGRRVTVTLAALRRAEPDLFEATAGLEPRVAELEGSVQQIGTRLQLLARQVGSNSAALSRLKGR